MNPIVLWSLLLAAPFGRWNLTVTGKTLHYPAWIEILPDGSARYVGKAGAARPVADLSLRGGGVSFSMKEYLAGRYELVKVDFTAANGQASGTVTREDGEVMRLRGAPAPSLPVRRGIRWGREVSLFNGRDLTGWRVLHPEKGSRWRVADGVLINEARGSNLVSEGRFQDFQVHLEFNCPPGCNSGIFLRGRYEVQIEDNETNPNGRYRMGAVYGFLGPASMPERRPGNWQSFDITLAGREVTVALNGAELISGQEIPGITGGALDNEEAAPGPIVLQGDHGGLSFRNIRVRTPEEP